MKRHAKLLQTKSRKHDIAPNGNGTWVVTSASSGSQYIVRDFGGNNIQCSCDWALYHPYKPCSHTLAVHEWLSQSAGRSASFWSDADDADRQHRPTEKISTGLWMTTRKV